MTETNVTTDFYRNITVIKNEGNTFLKVGNNTYSKYEQAYLEDAQADKIGLALLDLPEVKEDSSGCLVATDFYRSVNANVKDVLEHGKALLAIGLELQKREQAAIAEAEAKIVAEEAAKAKAEEEELDKLRTDVIHEHKDAFGYTFFPPYAHLSVSERRVVDALVELIQADRKRQAEVSDKFIL